jgi:competence protein ComFB
MKMKELRNYTEEAVKIFMERWFKEANCCQCDDCKLDVMAMMLNQLPPKYVATEKGALFAQMDEFDPQNRVDFITLMMQAADKVKYYPRHTKPADV